MTDEAKFHLSLSIYGGFAINYWMASLYGLVLLQQKQTTRPPSTSADWRQDADWGDCVNMVWAPTDVKSVAAHVILEGTLIFQLILYSTSIFVVPDPLIQHWHDEIPFQPWPKTKFPIILYQQVSKFGRRDSIKDERTEHRILSIRAHRSPSIASSRNNLQAVITTVRT